VSTSLASNRSLAQPPTTLAWHLAVGRLGDRTDADLARETKLLQHLDHQGLTVPVPIPTTDGRLFADGLVVMTYVVGGPPETEADWRRLANTLHQLHRLTQGWPRARGGDRRRTSCMPRRNESIFDPDRLLEVLRSRIKRS
jgi:Ser/Thr protein kinase RdoA (MazF antagonist)